MSGLQILTHAATLKGYLLATKAPKHMVDLAQAIVDIETEQVFERSRHTDMRNEDVRIPKVDVAQMAAMIGEASKTTPAHDDSRFAAPEKPVVQVELDPETKALEVTREANPYAWNGKQKRREDAVLKLADLPEIEAHLSAKSIREVARIYGVSHTGLRDFLKRVARPASEVTDGAQEKPQPEGNDLLVEGHEGRTAEIAPNSHSPEKIFSHADGTPNFICPKTGRMFVKLRSSDLPAILDELKEKTFDQVGALHNVNSGTLKAFLQANDIDPRQFNKTTGRQGRDYERGLAKQAGKKSYNGKPCASCGSTLKATSSGACIKCTRDRTAQWRKDKHSPSEPPTVLPAPQESLKNFEDEASEAPEDSQENPPAAHSKNADAIGERSYRPSILTEWPPGINYGGNNEYPDAPPYNCTHPSVYVGTALRGGSSASQASMGGW